MKTTSRIVCSALLCALVFALASTAAAQSNRVFASARTGSDANTCNNIATPCQTLQGAVNQVTAGGTVLVLDTGGYGPVSIGKAVSIEAPPGIEAFIHPPSGAAISITAGGADVIVLRGLTLSGGPSYGVDFIAGGALHVERCVIQGFQTGIAALRGSNTVVSDVFVEDTVIRNCSGDAIALLTFAGVVRGTIDGCTLEGNGSFGLDTFSNSRVVVRKTVAAGNSVGIGVGADGAGRAADLTIDSCTAASNGVAGIQSDSINGGSAISRISGSTVTGNGGPTSTAWGGVRQFAPAQCFSRNNNTVEGNSIDLIGTVSSYAPR